MILSLEGIFKWVHLRISAFRIVLNIGFDGTDRAYLRKVLQSHLHESRNRKREFSGLFVQISAYLCDNWFKMSFRPTCCPRGKRRSNHEINRYVYRP